MPESTKSCQIFVDNSNVAIVTNRTAWSLERRVEDPREVKRAGRWLLISSVIHEATPSVTATGYVYDDIRQD